MRLESYNNKQDLDVNIIIIRDWHKKMSNMKVNNFSLCLKCEWKNLFHDLLCAFI